MYDGFDYIMAVLAIVAGGSALAGIVYLVNGIRMHRRQYLRIGGWLLVVAIVAAALMLEAFIRSFTLA